MKHFMVTLVLCLAVTGLGAQSYKQVNDIPYTVKTDDYARERLKLDVYYPEGEKDCPQLVLICGDRELELYGRYDENQYLARLMKLVGHQETYLYELDGHGHGTMVDPSFHILETHLNSMLGKRVDP